MEMNAHLLGQETEDQDKYNLDFMYSQIKELGDQIDTYNQETGSPEESSSILRGFIIEKKNIEGFPLFKNDKIFVSIVDYKENSDRPLKLEIQIISPTIIEENGNKIKEKLFRLNASDIENFINNLSENLGYLEIAIKNNYIIEENDEKISKEISFHGGNEEIALLRSEILKLSSKQDILRVKQINLNLYTIICKDFQFSIFITPNHLVIKGKLENINSIESFYPIIESIMNNNKQLFGTKNTQDIQNDSNGGIRNLFSLTSKKERKPITEIQDKKLDEMLQYIMNLTSYLNDFKTNLENGFLDDIKEFDKDIGDDIKNIAIILIQNILSLSKGLLENPNPKDMLYVSHLINHFNNGIKTPNLLFIYQYIINDKDLEKKYGEKIRKKILETREYKLPLFSQLFTCGDTDYYDSQEERGHDIMFSEDSMQIIGTNSDNTGLVSHNIVLGQTEIVKNIKKKKYKKISSDGKHVLVEKKAMFDYYVQNIINLADNSQVQVSKSMNQPNYKKGIFHKEYFISIFGGQRGNKNFDVYNMDTNSSSKIDVSISMKTHHISGDKLYYFETKDHERFISFNSYNLSNSDINSLDFTIKNDETPLDFVVTDNKLFLVVQKENEKLILRSFDIENTNIDSDSIKDCDISGLKNNFEATNMHISNDGYILLQDENDIYIINTNNNLVYKHTPDKKIKHLFKVQFVNSPQYGHFAICRDGNQIHKIDIGLIEKFIEGKSLEEINKKMEMKEQKILEEQKKDEKAGKIIKIQKGDKDNRQGLENLGQSELLREMVVELRDNGTINTMILQELKFFRENFHKLEKENQELKETIEGMKKKG